MNSWQKGFLINGKSWRLSEKVSFQSLVAVGGVGKGKSTTLVIPNLLTMDNCSTVVLDTSGEIYEQTSGELARKGFKIKVLNLMDVTAGEAYNPLKNANTFTEIQQVAKLIVDSSMQNQNDPFWSDNAKTLIQIFIQVLKNKGEERFVNLGNIKYLLNNFDSHLANGKDAKSRIDEFVLTNTVGDRSTYEEYRGFTSSGNEKTMLSFVSTANSALNAISNPDIANLTANNSIDFASLRREKTALFVLVRQQDIGFYSFLINLFFTDLFNTLMHELDDSHLPVYAILDEFAHLTLPNFPVWAATARKYKIAFFVFLQSLSQLEVRYGRKNAEAILEAIQSEFFFPGVGIDTAKMLERRIGRIRVPYRQGGETLFREETLLPESKIAQMKDGEALYFYSNRPPLKLKTKPFYKRSDMLRASKIAPVPFTGAAQIPIQYVNLPGN